MTPATFSKATVDKILSLSAQEKTAGEIAHTLQLHRMEVLAVIAHQRLNPAEELSEEQENGSDVGFHEAPHTGGITPNLSDGLKEPSRREVEPAEEDRPSGVYVGDDIEFSTPVTWDPRDSARVQNP